MVYCNNLKVNWWIWEYFCSPVCKLFSKFNCSSTFMCVQLVIHVGVSGVAQEVNLEQQSFNKGYTALDICQHLPENNCCFPDASDCLKSGLDMATICQEINNSGENVFSCVSLDPGQYLCGYTYYISLNIDRDKVAFVHVPVLDKPYSVDQLAGALGQILKLMLAQVHRKSLW